MTRCCLKPVPEGIELRVFVQPRASRNKLVEWRGDELKIALAAPPVDGAANKACCVFLAKTFGLSRGAVQLLSGESSRHKRLLLAGATLQEVTQSLESRGLDIPGASH